MLASSFVTACGGLSGRDSGAGGAPSNADAELTEFVIPLSPRDEAWLSFMLVEDEATGERRLDGESVVRLAVGEGYPDVMRVGISSALLLPDWEVLPGKELTIEAATSDGDGVEAIVLDSTTLELRVHEPGTHHVWLDLVAAFEAGGASIDFRAEVTVRALEVAGAEWSNCSAARTSDWASFGSRHAYPSGSSRSSSTAP